MSIIHDPKASARWRDTAQQLQEVTDGLSMPIDEGILDTCIALNVLGFVTDMSCEGHLDRTIQAPWVLISNSEVHSLRHQAAVIHEEAHVFDGEIIALYRSTGTMSATVQDAMQRARALNDQADQLLAEEQYRLLQHLQAFYAEHTSSVDQRIIMNVIQSSDIRLLSQGAWTSLVLPLELQEQKLREYQAEMQAFTAYLITCC